MEPLSLAQFWNGISILLQNFHAVHKKTVACVVNEVLKVELWNAEEDCNACTNPKDSALCTVSTETELQTYLQSIHDKTQSKCDGFVIHCRFLTKKSNNDIVAKSKIDFVTSTYKCEFQSNSFDDYCVQYRSGQIAVEMLTNRLNVEKDTRWAEYVLKPKLLKWCLSSPCKLHVRSLQLIDVEYYTNLYKKLKIKYADSALEFWKYAQESTDPLKFIYEDLAIAAYLITLWRDSVPTAFADLGCGNGLLVYILNAEGYKGYGYDVRARKIWSCYPKTIQLLEQTIEPYTFKLPPEVDWLIGNHSDELSPWLPVLAATANYKMNYFLLPCCAYEFSGVKFQRRNSSLSVYQDFYAYAHLISQKCGFNTMQDRLKIPSTKRLALVGIKRNHTEAEYETRSREIGEFVKIESQNHAYGVKAEMKLRDKQESVRNCTQIDKNTIDVLVEKIFRILLSREQERQDTAVTTSHWKAGGRLTMHHIVEYLTKDDLKNIKSECGGIKTLLRNKHEIFEFCNNEVCIKKPRLRCVTTLKPQTVKKRVCFFKQHHPDGCPLTEQQCTFIH